MKSNGEHEKERKWQVTQQVASNLIVVAGGIVLYLTLNNLDVVKDVVGELIGILSPFMAGLVLAYLLDGLARFFQQKLLGGKHRTFAVILAYMVTLLLLGLLLRIVLPQVVQSITVLVNRVPEYLRSLNTLVKDLSEQYGLDAKGLEALVGSYQDLIRKATDIVSNLLPQVVSYSAAIGSGVVSALTAVISSLYMMLSKETLLRQIRKLIWALMPEKAARRTLPQSQCDFQRLYQRQDHRQRDHRPAVLCGYQHSAYAVCGADQCDRGRYQRDPILWPVYRCHSQHDDPADFQPVERIGVCDFRAGAPAV